MNFKHPEIAVVAMSGIFPGAGNTERFITNILNKKETVIKVPDHRWAARPEIMVSQSSGTAYQDTALSDRAGLITDFQFDSSGLNIDKALLAELDPVHHLVLSAGRQLFEACSLAKEIRKRTGVILAAIALPTPGSSKFSRELFLSPTPAMPSASTALGASMLSAPGSMLSRAFGLSGGCYTLDAACASSLFAIKLACEQLVTGKADAMVAGGVSRPESLYTQVGFSQLQALSPSGRCAPFDRNADGLVVGEGTGLVVLKRLDDAIACNDTIHGVIRGWGVSNDLEGNLVAPASEGQIRAMKAAYDMADWSLADIQYMECHGSGTPKGDQVEAASISSLVEQYQCPDSPLSIGSVKSTIGHLLTAAGAAGFIKTLSAMKRQTLPPSLNFTGLPDKSPLHGTGVIVQTEPDPWKPATAGSPRRAGISAFGFGGINAHILVEEFNREAKVHQVPATVPLSQKDIPCAIVGMAAISGAANNLAELSDLIFGVTTSVPRSGAARWRRFDHLPDDLKDLQTLFLDDLSFDLKDFNIPPNQLADILPQHLVMLQAAKAALEDAGIAPKPGQTESPRTRIGCAMGIEFDFGATDYHLRWFLKNQTGSIEHDTLNRLSPGLSFDRTLGALGGIVASRVARAFKLGGPCFTVSSDTASGLSALEIGINSIAAGETDIYLCGAVDMAGDIRSFTRNLALSGMDANTLPSEGSVALVLKRLDKAQKDGDKIYALVKGFANTAGAPSTGENITPGKETDFQEVYQGALHLALKHSKTQIQDLSFASILHSQQHMLGKIEHNAIENMAQKNRHDLPIFCTSSFFGHTGAAAGLFSVAATGLCLSENRQPGSMQHTDKSLNLASVGCLSHEGTAVQLILEALPGKQTDETALSLNPAQSTDKNSGTIVKIPLSQMPIPESLISMNLTRSVDKGSTREMPNNRDTFRDDDVSQDSHILSDTQLILGNPELLAQTQEITTRAHERFLEMSGQNTNEMTKQLAAIADAENTESAGQDIIEDTFSLQFPRKPFLETSTEQLTPQRVFLNREQCLEYAVGKAGDVLGPEFDIIDTYPVRVRLPDEPLMLVDRIISVEGEMLSLTRGKIVTQHDVLENVWYLDGGKTPVSISIEAGQADLFLCAWLGIDHIVKGTRKYRLLDAKVTFHRTLPEPGETIEYHIEIDRFLRQGEIYLFFFHYKGYIDGRLFISMRDGCAGFFTEEEVENSGGIILKKEDKETVAPGEPVSPQRLVSMKKESYSDDQVEALRRGDLETAFGQDFKGKVLGQNQWLPGGRMSLIHRVLEIDPTGGRFGKGRIIAEADIHPDDWFLTCHFIDDMVMPGTLMYECCAHTLRVFIQRMGWISSEHQVHYDVLPENESDLKCRGPVTPQTRKARYDIEIKALGFGPEPFVVADAHMFSDDLEIVLYKDMGMKLVGVTHQDLMAFWRKK